MIFEKKEKNICLGVYRAGNTVIKLAGKKTFIKSL